MRYCFGTGDFRVRFLNVEVEGIFLQLVEYKRSKVTDEGSNALQYRLVLQFFAVRGELPKRSEGVYPLV